MKLVRQIVVGTAAKLSGIDGCQSIESEIQLHLSDLLHKRKRCPSGMDRHLEAEEAQQADNQQNCKAVNHMQKFVEGCVAVWGQRQVLTE